ncbi:MAG TPA: UTRA domain-containing protein, partial [Vicinamibacterales bacterium]|nr:UTRA domain-containing protein [Vicinamibacterales bacterium]
TPTIERGIDELFGLADVIERLGYTASEGAWSVEIMSGPQPIADELRLETPVELCHLRRTRLADRRPVILCDDYFALDLLQRQGIRPDEMADEVIGRGSLYEWLEERLGLRIDTALTRIEPMPADADTAHALGVPEGTALLRLRQTHHTPDGVPVLYSENVHNSDVIHFRVVRHRRARRHR